MNNVLCRVLGAFVTIATFTTQPLFAQGTAFTYQGKLNDSGGAANGTYDLRFTIYDSTNLPGVLVAGPLTNSGTMVSNGLFTVALDFGPSVFTGPDRWLEIGVRTNGAAAFVTLTARQNITSAPYAISAGNLGGVLYVNSNNTNGSPNIIGGAPNNQIDPGVIGSVIGGGGTTNYFGNVFSNRVAGDFSVVGGGFGNVNQGVSAVISGGVVNQIQAGGSYSGIASGGRNLIEAGTDESFIGGGYGNSVQSFARDSVIGGGLYNTNGATQSVIAGGQYNVIESGAASSAIGGGGGNTIGTNSIDSTIAGGFNNSIRNNSPYATIAGGVDNTIDTNSDIAMIAGGHDSTIQAAPYAFIGGGGYNMILPGAYDSVIAGGGFGTIQTNSHSSVIGGGGGNSIQTNAVYSTIGGGWNNSIQPNAQYATIGGGQFNLAGYLSTVGGGQFNVISNAFFGTIGGGVGNSIGSSVQYGTIGGGNLNKISQFAHGSTIAGGWSNSILFNVQIGAIGGGFANVIPNGGDYSFIGGGIENSNNGYISVIGGGDNNNIEALSDRSVIGGGGNNRIKGSQAFAVYATIGGGQFNLTQSNSIYPTIGGGLGNTVQTNAQYATIPGGLSNTVAGAYSFAAGNRAQAMHDGTFVWADANGTNFSSSSSNQFLIRAGGGVGIGVTNPTAALEVAGTVKATAFQGSGSGLTIGADSISSGTLSDARLSGNVALLNASQTFSGPNTFGNAANSFTGNGAGLTGLSAGNVTSGTLAASRLPANAALLNASQTFSGANIFNGNVGIGTGTPQAQLNVSGNTRVDGANQAYNEGLALNLPTDMVGGGFGGIHFHNAVRGAAFSASTIKWGIFYNYTPESGSTGSGLSFVQNNVNTRLYISTNGNVGIGTNNPQSALHIPNGEIRWGRTNSLSLNQGGSIELGDSGQAGATPFIDFHYGVAGSQDFNVRVINDATTQLSFFWAGSSTPLARLNTTGLTVNGTFVSSSDRNVKQDFADVNSRTILEKVAQLPIQTWAYKNDPTTKHLGPVAQDFYATFGIGPDDKHIATVDEGGVALAAIQGLNQKLEQKETEMAELKRKNDLLEKRLLALEEMMRGQK